MNAVYKRFKGCQQILSYRFGESLEQPYDKFDSAVSKQGIFKCVQEQTSNYGTNEIKVRQLFEVPEQKFSIALHLEAIDGTRTKH